MTLIDELLVGLGFEYDPKEMKQFKDDVGKTVNVVKSLTKAAITGAVAITGMTVASAKASDVQGKLAGEIGETVENVDALQFAAQIAGGTADGMATSLRNLSSRASEASRGVGSGLEVFGMLGIQVTDLNGKLKPTSELLLEVSDQFQNFSKAQQIEFAEKLGMSDSILLLQQGKVSISELIAEAEALGTTTAEDAALAADFNDSLTKVWQVIKSMTRTLVRELIPVMKEGNDEFVEWWKINKDLIKQQLPVWLDKITKGFKLFTIAVAGFLAFKIVGHIITLISLMKGLTVATLAANAAAILLPALIAAFAVAFIALVEDAKVFFEGGESFIGDMIKKFPAWTSEIQTAASVLGTVADLTTMIFDGWSAIFDLFKSDVTFDDFKEVLGNIPGFLGDVTGLSTVDGGGIIPEIGSSISNASSTVVDKLEIIVQGGADTADNIANAVLNVFEQTSQDLNSAVDQ